MDEPTLVVGVVTSAHGLRGEVAVQNRSDNPDRWAPGGDVMLPDGRKLTIASSRPHGRRLLVRFEGIEDRSAAERLRGVTLVVPASWLPPLEEGSWWAHGLEGCRVLTRSGRVLGVLTEVVANPANDIWVATAEDGTQTLIPVLGDLLVEVDPAGKTIVVADVPGITGPDEAEPG